MGCRRIGDTYSLVTLLAENCGDQKYLALNADHSEVRTKGCAADHRNWPPITTRASKRNPRQ